VTGDGLYLFVTPDVSRPGNAASKLWRMGYRFHSRQKTYSIGPYGNGRDGTFSLADARRERDKAKDLLKEGKDPSTEKQLDKHRKAAVRLFEQWADEWLAKKKVEKVKRGTPSRDHNSRAKCFTRDREGHCDERCPRYRCEQASAGRYRALNRQEQSELDDPRSY
jgi:hypothetical protein